MATASKTLAALFPKEVKVWCETEKGCYEELFPEELEYIAGAVEKRRRDFVVARYCARRALSSLGIEREPMVPGHKGEPRWPSTVVGSITHTKGLTAAAVTRSSSILGLGIDAEPEISLSSRTMDRIADVRQLPQLGFLGPSGGIFMFSAKESVFKALFPVYRDWIGFEDLSVHLSEDGSFKVDYCNKSLISRVGGLGILQGRWACWQGLALTTAVLWRK